jgi:hypothetical protein
MSLAALGFRSERIERGEGHASGNNGGFDQREWKRSKGYVTSHKKGFDQNKFDEGKRQEAFVF